MPLLGIRPHRGVGRTPVLQLELRYTKHSLHTLHIFLRTLVRTQHRVQRILPLPTRSLSWLQLEKPNEQRAVSFRSLHATFQVRGASPFNCERTQACATKTKIDSLDCTAAAHALGGQPSFDGRDSSH